MMVTSDVRPEMEIWPFCPWWRQILDRKCTNGRFAHSQYKIRYITLIYGRIAKISASNRKSGSRNTLVHNIWSTNFQENHQLCCHQMSDFEAKIHQIAAPDFESFRGPWPRPRYGDFPNFQNGGRRHLRFWNYKLLTVGGVMSVELRHHFKFRSVRRHR